MCVCMWETCLQLVHQVYNTTGCVMDKIVAVFSCVCVMDKTVAVFHTIACMMVGPHHTHPFL